MDKDIKMILEKLIAIESRLDAIEKKQKEDYEGIYKIVANTYVLVNRLKG